LDDLKALRDEMVELAFAPDHHGDNKRFSIQDIAARLTSIIERNEKERAFTEAVRAALCDSCVLMNGWHSDGTDWSEWDEQVYNGRRRRSRSSWTGKPRPRRRRNDTLDKNGGA
jgi:hypothetical protein